MSYKGFEIEEFGSLYSVLYCGDEVIFSSQEEAKDFVDEVTEA